MSSDAREDESRRSLAVPVVVALFVTGLVYVDFWGGTLPSLADPVPLAVGAAGGVVVGVAAWYLGTSPDAPRVSFRTGLLLMAVAVLAGFLLFPDGLAVPFEVGLVAMGWTDVAARAVQRYAGR